MEKGKSITEIEKNKLSNSNVSAGEKVHIGDIYHINHQNNGNEKGTKVSLLLKYIGITLLSVTLVGITINKLEINLFPSKSETNNIIDSSKTVVPPPVIPKTVVDKKPKPAAIKYTNALELTTSPPAYNGYLSSKMGELLRAANIKYQQSSSGNIVNHIKCNFDLQKTKTQSGVREAFQYSLSLQVDVIGGAGQFCFSGFYASSKPRIGYPEDSEDDLRRKVIEPLFAEVKTAFQSNMPTLCEAQ